MYYVSFRGKKREVSAGVFWALAVPLLAIFACVLFLIFAMCAGLVKAGGWIALIAALFIFAKVTVTANGKEHVYAIIRNEALRGFLGFPVMLTGFYFYFFR